MSRKINFESINTTVKDVLRRYYKSYDSESISSIISLVDFCVGKELTDEEIPDLSRMQCIVSALMY